MTSLPQALPFLFIHLHPVNLTLSYNLTVNTELVRNDQGVEHPSRVGVPCREVARWARSRRSRCGDSTGLPQGEGTAQGPCLPWTFPSLAEAVVLTWKVWVSHERLGDPLAQELGRCLGPTQPGASCAGSGASDASSPRLTGGGGVQRRTGPREPRREGGESGERLREGGERGSPGARLSQTTAPPRPPGSRAGRLSQGLRHKESSHPPEASPRNRRETGSPIRPRPRGWGGTQTQTHAGPPSCALHPRHTRAQPSRRFPGRSDADADAPTYVPGLVRGLPGPSCVHARAGAAAVPSGSADWPRPQRAPGAALSIHSSAQGVHACEAPGPSVTAVPHAIRLPSPTRPPRPCRDVTSLRPAVGARAALPAARTGWAWRAVSGERAPEASADQAEVAGRGAGAVGGGGRR